MPFDPPPTLILAALRVEAEIVAGTLGATTEASVHGKAFRVAAFGARQAILGWTGMGKANAAMVTTMAALHFVPELVICTGVAGGLDPSLIPGDVLIGQRCAYHDFGALRDGGMEPWPTWNPLTFTANPHFFAADADAVRTVARVAATTTLEVCVPELRAPGSRTGTIVTGDQFMASAARRRGLREQFGADACEMEAAAVAQVCWQLGIPWAVIKGISDIDGAIGEGHLAGAMRNAARVVGAAVRQGMVTTEGI